MITSFLSKQVNKKMYTNIPVNELPGTHKKSFILSFMGADIWFEHLDGMYSYTDEVIQKFIKDLPNITKPSAPSLVSVNLDETLVDERLVDIIADTYIINTRFIHKLVFVGLNKHARKIMMRAFKKRNGQYQFAINYVNDFEKAKEWLVAG